MEWATAEKRATPCCRSALREIGSSTRGETFRNGGALSNVLLLTQIPSTRAGSTGQRVEGSQGVNCCTVVSVGDTETISVPGGDSMLSASSYAGPAYICDSSVAHSGSRSA